MAQANGVPFLAFRAVSYLAGGRSNATDTDMTADTAPAALSPREQASQAAHGDNRGLTPASAWQP
ncbi:hypothetical protein D8I35_16330 [Corticibacter populi]|uniref:Uncharacterized protein n=1 Tax=Corticibacter populi TaxID=1550736 RepID=A0A3M6QK19_9BURK|nr:hypothetical protein D8I35_16330 [Corticibacter populi]